MEKEASSVRALYRPLYSMGEGARLLQIPQQKMRRWIDGFAMQGRIYPPVIREFHTGSDEVTWAEFVEAGFLREYRAKDVSLQKLRPLIDRLRHEFQVPYPLAHFKPLVDSASRDLVLRLQQLVELEEEFFLVRPIGKRPGEWQVEWAAPVEAFLEKIEFDSDGVAERMRPLGKRSPVTIDPDLAFGIPQVHGVRTEVIAEAFATGETKEAIATSWGLTITDVDAALGWERALSPVA